MRYIFCLLVLSLFGCATRPRSPQTSEIDQERRVDHEVFYSNWLRPSVSEEDKDFFYRPFWKER